MQTKPLYGPRKSVAVAAAILAALGKVAKEFNAEIVLGEPKAQNGHAMLFPLTLAKPGSVKTAETPETPKGKPGRPASTAPGPLDGAVPVKADKPTHPNLVPAIRPFQYEGKTMYIGMPGKPNLGKAFLEHIGAGLGKAYPAHNVTAAMTAPGTVCEYNGAEYTVVGFKAESYKNPFLVRHSGTGAVWAVNGAWLYTCSKVRGKKPTVN